MIFCDAHKAAEMMGLSYRHFQRKYVDTHKLKAHTFKLMKGRVGSRLAYQKFLVRDVEALRDKE